MKWIILDTETTGTSHEDRICQLSYLVCDEKGIQEVHNALVQPPLPVSFESMAVHHITPEMLEGQPICTQSDAFSHLEALNHPENVLIIHNAVFDLEMLAKEGFVNQMRVIDTFRLLRAWYPLDTPHTLQYKRYQWGLYHHEEALIQQLGIVLRAHDALSDVIVLKHLFDYLLQHHALESMIEICASPILLEYIPFGKHKGKSFSQVAQEARHDLRYMMDHFTLDEDLEYTLSVALEGGEIRLGFGKYKGQTPAEVVQIDRPYLVWLRHKATQLDPEMASAIDQVL